MSWLGIAQVVAGCVLLLAGIPASGQSSAPLSDFQSWNEVDVSARVAQHLDAQWVSQGRFSTGYPNPATYLSGVDLKIGVGSHLEVTPSYYYLAFESTSGSKGHFQVPMLAATVRIEHEGWKFSERNRFMGAIGGGREFWIYVNRPRVDWEASRKWSASLFAWDEVFYFSLLNKWNRNRFAAGARKAFGERWAADAYYLRQDDSVLQPRRINGLGLTLEVRIR